MAKAEPGEPEWREKSLVVERAAEGNLDVSTLFIVKCVAHNYIQIILIGIKCIFLLSSSKTYLQSELLAAPRSSPRNIFVLKGLIAV